MRNNERQFSPRQACRIGFSLFFLTFICPSPLVLPSSTESRDTLIKISSDRLYMIFAFYSPRIDDGCGFWEREINISSRLRQLYMHDRRARKLESNSLTHGEGVGLAWRGKGCNTSLTVRLSPFVY